jgi:hypothetical protein
LTKPVYRLPLSLNVHLGKVIRLEHRWFETKKGQSIETEPVGFCKARVIG